MLSAFGGLIDFRYKYWVRHHINAAIIVGTIGSMFAAITIYGVELPDSPLMQKNVFLREMNRQYPHLQNFIHSLSSDYQHQWIILTIVLHLVGYFCNASMGLLQMWAFGFSYATPLIAVAVSTVGMQQLGRNSCSVANMTLQTDFIVAEGVFAFAVIVWVSILLGKAFGNAGLNRGVFFIYFLFIGVPLFHPLLWADSSEFLRFRFFLERQYAAYVAGVRMHQAMGWLHLGMSNVLRAHGLSIFDCLLNVMRYFTPIWIQLGNTDNDALTNIWILSHLECMDNYRAVFLAIKVCVVLPCLYLGYLHGTYSRTHALTLERRNMDPNYFAASPAATSTKSASNAAPKAVNDNDDDDDDDDSRRVGRVKSGKGGSPRSRSRGAGSSKAK